MTGCLFVLGSALRAVFSLEVEPILEKLENKTNVLKKKILDSIWGRCLIYKNLEVLPQLTSLDFVLWHGETVLTGGGPGHPGQTFGPDPSGAGLFSPFPIPSLSALNCMTGIHLYSSLHALDLVIVSEWS